jgi:cytochrome oxidase Cu insertion factor (SCO1/SenC/PrrC family)
VCICAEAHVNHRQTDAAIAIARHEKFLYRYGVMETNQKAPAFTLPDENGNPVSLEQFRGKTVVLFFYPKASTPG